MASRHYKTFRMATVIDDKVMFIGPKVKVHDLVTLDQAHVFKYEKTFQHQLRRLNAEARLERLPAVYPLEAPPSR